MPTRTPPFCGATRAGLVVTADPDRRVRGVCQRTESGAVERTTTPPSVRTAASHSRPTASTVVAGEE